MSFAVPYEALGPGRFQQFCATLLSYEHPLLQVYPLFQADGGRDASATSGAGRNDLIFQVKFVEQPGKAADPVTWLRRILAKERSNIEALASRGVTAYRILTNMPGTARVDRGTIDRVDALLADLPIADAQCWWRDDIDIRLAKHRVLKWSYRELLTGDDVLDQLVSAGLTGDRERRSYAIRSFLAAQYDEDSQVRFRQIELRNNLLDLWIDVPITKASIPAAWLRSLPSADGSAAEARLSLSSPGAARLLLHSHASSLDRALIHGGPGQGKSTLAQYLGQVHRARLLGRSADLKLFGDDAHSPLRLPIKVVLRDLATFLTGTDPFVDDRELPDDVPRSLDSFLAHLISTRAGGDSFDVSDLKAVLATGPILLILDGFDEVANIEERRLVTRAIEDGSVTLSASAPGLRTVVTSRPLAIRGLNPDRWTLLSLAPLSKALVHHYAERWSEARKLTAHETTELRALLNKRLRDPIFADLVRNPMQLAIVLSLLDRLGESLPDKRTELYSAYMNHFLEREGSKSKLVAQRRRLIFNLHGYIGFVMHCDAELGARADSIGQADLLDAIRRFLSTAEESEALANALLHGVVDRVMALVSRKEGQFEFEVQPLREFFAGYHLYETKRTARLGRPCPGTLPDRFDALARNPYWLNTLRFFAGHYGSAELASLADGLDDLISDPEWGITDHPRTLMAMLLNDQVFALNVKARRRAISYLVDGIPGRHTLSISPTAAASGLTEVHLTDRTSTTALAHRCIDALSQPLSPDRRSALALVLRRHRLHFAIREAFAAALLASGPTTRGEWIEVGSRADLLRRLPLSFQAEMSWDDDLKPTAAGWLALNHPTVVEASQRLSAGAVEGLLDLVWTKDLNLRQTDHLLVRIAGLVQDAVRAESTVAQSQKEFETSIDTTPLDTPENDTMLKASAVLAAVEQARTHYQRWDLAFIDAMHAQFGEHLTLSGLAISLARIRVNRAASAASGVASLSAFARVTLEMVTHGSETELVELTRSADAAGQGMPHLIMLALLQHVPEAHIDAVAAWLEQQLETLTDEQFRIASRFVLDGTLERRTAGPLPARFDLVARSSRLAAMFLSRVPLARRPQVALTFVREAGSVEPCVAGAVGDVLFDLLRTQPDGAHVAAAIREVYAGNVTWMPREPTSRWAISSEIARLILQRPDEYPLILLEHAERIISAELRRDFAALRTVASEQRWFDDGDELL